MAEHITYADESGTHGDKSPFCVVAGYVGSHRQWGYFEKEWLEVLGNFSVPEFHSVEFFRRRYTSRSSKSPYRGWPETKASNFMTQLVSILMKRKLYPVGSAVDIKAFDSFSRGERQFLSNGRLKKGTSIFVSSGAPVRPPYQLAFSTMLYVAAERGDIVKSGV